MLLLVERRQGTAARLGHALAMAVMTAGGAVATPFIFSLMDWCNRALGYRPRTKTVSAPTAKSSAAGRNCEMNFAKRNLRLRAFAPLR
jgi:hypothetical protein